MASPRNSRVSYESCIAVSGQHEWCVNARSNNERSRNVTCSSASSSARLSSFSIENIIAWVIYAMLRLYTSKLATFFALFHPLVRKVPNDKRGRDKSGPYENGAAVLFG